MKKPISPEIKDAKNKIHKQSFVNLLFIFTIMTLYASSAALFYYFVQNWLSGSVGYVITAILFFPLVAYLYEFVNYLYSFYYMDMKLFKFYVCSEKFPVHSNISFIFKVLEKTLKYEKGLKNLIVASRIKWLRFIPFWNAFLYLKPYSLTKNTILTQRKIELSKHFGISIGW